MGKKRKLDVDSTQSTQSVGKRTQVPSLTFRVAKPPVHTTSHSTTTSLVTTLRKGTSGRRGQRREHLHNHPPASPSEQQRPDEVIPDPPLPDLDYLNDVHTIPPMASGPKGVKKNKTSVSVHLNIFGAANENQY